MTSFGHSLLRVRRGVVLQPSIFRRYILVFLGGYPNHSHELRWMSSPKVVETSLCNEFPNPGDCLFLSLTLTRWPSMFTANTDRRIQVNCQVARWFWQRTGELARSCTTSQPAAGCILCWDAGVVGTMHGSFVKHDLFFCLWYLKSHIYTYAFIYSYSYMVLLMIL